MNLGQIVGRPGLGYFSDVVARMKMASFATCLMVGLKYLSSFMTFIWLFCVAPATDKFNTKKDLQSKLPSTNSILLVGEPIGLKLRTTGNTSIDTFSSSLDSCILLPLSALSISASGSYR
ncbi:uncharacterized protein N7477_004290 [Penicillium maclennaniae]|uniref:uncharacterized protein n=1 Tax=Penicillium maclennaniae TaxID=1343394 RepID=UPI00253FB120|nr:uncharacterized protein N7477_004290 [Penicillium maclennaniae]KAJ5674356.1 hypothetical protein N7477_004290 [Penicillium maclennaniae]